MIFNNKFINLKLKKNLNKNLIFKKVNYQEKVDLEQLKNVKVKQINNIMQLNELNKKKIKQILKKFKQDYN